MPEQQESVAQEVVYESQHVSLSHRLLVALGSGLAVFCTMSFLRWGCGIASVDRRGLLSGMLIGGTLSLGLAIVALRSRVIWRITLDRTADELRIDRDPDAVERWKLTDLSDARAVPVAGGWSRDPAERLMLQLLDGREQLFSLPDDALTEGIAGDIRGALRRIETRQDVAEDPAGGVAGAGDIREEGIEGAALRAVAVSEPTGDGDGRRG